MGYKEPESNEVWVAERPQFFKITSGRLGYYCLTLNKCVIMCEEWLARTYKQHKARKWKKVIKQTLKGSIQDMHISILSHLLISLLIK